MHAINSLVFNLIIRNFTKEMKLLNSKYKVRINLLFLTAYLFTFTAGIIHYHNYDFCFTETFDSESKQKSNHFQILNGSASECIIHQNFISIQTAINNFFVDLQLIRPDRIFLTFSENKNHFSSVHLSNNFLRAPPVLSLFN